MASNSQMVAPEHTAVRVALWRALHVQIDPKPHILADEIGAMLVGEENWRNRPDMNPDFSKGMRASIVGRARFIEDLVEEQSKQGVTQYVILGAGLDTFAQRRPEIASRLHIFEVDQPGPQAWKQNRLTEVGLGVPEGLHFVPVDFEAGESWWERLIAEGFDQSKPAIVVSTGVSMYLTKETNLATLAQMARLAPGSTFAMTFLLSLDLVGPQERATLEFVMKRAEEAGTPFLSLFSPAEILAMAKESGFKKSLHVSSSDLYDRYFANRTDGLNAGSAEGFLVAMT
ncbi:MAG: class I SAM-dependent methyltransferase [Bdellovibrionia bacterium]